MKSLHQYVSLFLLSLCGMVMLGASEAAAYTYTLSLTGADGYKKTAKLATTREITKERDEYDKILGVRGYCQTSSNSTKIDCFCNKNTVRVFFLDTAPSKKIEKTYFNCACAMGYIQRADGSCFPCSRGWSTNHKADQTSCTKCPKGTYAFEEGSPGCTSCASIKGGGWNDVEGSAGCKVLPENATLNKDATGYTCNEGYWKFLNYAHPKDNTCQPCPANYAFIIYPIFYYFKIASNIEFSQFHVFPFLALKR